MSKNILDQEGKGWGTGIIIENTADKVVVLYPDGVKKTYNKQEKSQYIEIEYEPPSHRRIKSPENKESE